MVNRRKYLEVAVGTTFALGHGVLTGCSQFAGSATSDDPRGTEPPDDDTEGSPEMTDLQFQPVAFDEGATIPEEYTCDGEDVSPPLAVGGVDEEAEALAIVVDDPDAPGGTFTHWSCWNLPADVEEIPEGVPAMETIDAGEVDDEFEALDDARQGTNDFGEVGYRGPCPPEGDDPHTYRFRLYALSEAVDVDPGAEKNALTDAIRDVQLATAEFTAIYGR